MALFVFQACVAVLLLEQINAIEHYGLERKRVGDGWERVGPRHSWDAPHRVSSYLLFKLQVHADHHLRMLLSFSFFLAFACRTCFSETDCLILFDVHPVYSLQMPQEDIKPSSSLREVPNCRLGTSPSPPFCLYPRSGGLSWIQCC